MMATTASVMLSLAVAVACKALIPIPFGRPAKAKIASTNEERWRDPEPWEIVRAVEKKDANYLIAVRDRAFHLLLHKTGDATPLHHAMRIGPSHGDIAILLVEAMCRWVTNLEDKDMDMDESKVLLKALRTNMKLAFKASLKFHQHDLIVSFLQAWVMSEGDRWLASQIHTIRLALRAPDGTETKPVETAADIMRDFATWELEKVKCKTEIDDYVANSSADLVMMAAWSIALDSIDGEPIPIWYFSREDRTYRAFTSRLEEHKVEIDRKLGKRVKWQLRVLEKALAPRSETMVQRMQVVREELDSEGPMTYLGYYT
ncbi:hypothetical protein FRC02_010044 [Tulasnella sp. 418]|nr:hypothetical protein FRC02_010044 [Tulasnella sp. 418]